jgi:hypothetical protein
MHPKMTKHKRTGAASLAAMRHALFVTLACACLWTLGASAEESAATQATACAQGEEAADGVCYPKCKDGFKGEGTLCKQICPERTQDTGAHCLSGPAQFRKKFYERAAAGEPKQ